MINYYYNFSIIKDAFNFIANALLTEKYVEMNANVAIATINKIITLKEINK